MSEAVKLPRSMPPQYHDRSSTAGIMWTVTACLLPAAGWGVYVFGASAFVVLAVTVLSSVVVEGIMGRLANRSTLHDGSAVLTGLLIGMGMPPGVPLYVPVVASVFALAVVKWTFGGLGGNWMNPALAGRVFVFFSWTGPMTGWRMPFTLLDTPGGLPEALSGATPLGIVQAGRRAASGATGGPRALLREAGYPVSSFDGAVTDWLNARVLGPLGIDLPGGYLDLFVGNLPGSIGELSALLLLLGTIVLFARRIITWQVPAAFFLTFALFTRAFGGLVHGQGFFSGDVLFAALTGGVVLVMFYMATDPVTSPVTTPGLLIYGAGAGALTFLLRTYGRFPEAVALAIILMNMLVPAIDRYLRPRRFGTRRGEPAVTRDPDRDAALPAGVSRAGEVHDAP